MYSGFVLEYFSPIWAKHPTADFNGALKPRCRVTPIHQYVVFTECYMTGLVQLLSQPVGSTGDIVGTPFKVSGKLQQNGRSFGKLI